jgi:fumarylacetoacetase
MTTLDETHQPTLRSWVESANADDTDFPIQNLPFGVFAHGEGGAPRVGIAIGDRILDVAAALDAQLLTGDAAVAAERCRGSRLNDLMALGRDAARALRLGASRLLRRDGEVATRAASAADRILVSRDAARMQLPFEVGDYTDFYASVFHATNVGSMFRPDNPLLPNYKWVPIGYHGRASSIVPSGAGVKRPCGQVRDEASAPPVVRASRRLDYELEIGIVIGEGNALGVPIPIAAAERHVFGVCLVNDWSARDLQTWEYQPLGPFLAKNFATTVSPWVVTLDALAPFRIPAFERATDDPQPLPYLSSADDRRSGGIDLTLEVTLASAAMRERGDAPLRVSRGSFATMYWTAAQLVTHHTVNGCNLQPGDLLASGTVSGPTRDSAGCLLERTWRGTEPLELPGGERRSFLEDGDEVVMRAWCERDAYRRIGLGECRGVVLSA